MTGKEKPPSDGWASESDYASSSPLEDDFLSERQITLTIQLPPVSLPGEIPESLPDSPEQVLADSSVHLDAWNRDRFERKSLPPSAAVQRGSASSLPPPYVTDLAPELEGEGDALALAARPSLPPPAPDLVTEMSERFALGDFSGALRVSELLLGQDPEHDLAQHYARESMGKLEGLYISRITAHGRVPVLLVPEGELRWFGLDSKVGSLIPHIDGESDFEAVLDRSGLLRLEALRCLAELVEANAVRLV